MHSMEYEAKKHYEKPNTSDTNGGKKKENYPCAARRSDRRFRQWWRKFRYGIARLAARQKVSDKGYAAVIEDDEVISR